MDDPFDLRRFVEAQDRGGTYDQALFELRAGAKASHWMWFIFPQLTGLGRSPTAQLYAISGLDEARAYLAHPVLGPRLRQSAQTLVDIGMHDPIALFGPIDALKLQSSMTLFGLAAPEERVFRDVLAQYFGGAVDHNTTSRL